MWYNAKKKGWDTVAVNLFNGQNVDLLWFNGKYVLGHAIHVFCENEITK